MRGSLGILILTTAFATGLAAAPIRVAVLDFENRAAALPAGELFGGVESAALADKGVHALNLLLANSSGFSLIDRRDFLRQVVAHQGADSATKTVSFLRAAQAVNADAVLRGVLLSYSPGSRTVDQGGYKTEFQSLALRVSLEALDVQDGTVIAASEGVAKRDFRKTAAEQTVLGEDDLLQLLQEALAGAVPALDRSFKARFAEQQSRPRVKLSVATDADPALVEIDGVLIGSTPLQDFMIYEGDHVITVGKAGYQDVNKQIMLSGDTAITVPLFRTQLSADEIKGILEKARMNVVLGNVEPAIIIDRLEERVP